MKMQKVLPRLILALGLATLLSATPAHAEESDRARSTKARSSAESSSLTQGVIDAAAEDRQKRAAEILRQMLPLDVATSMASARPTSGFGSEMSRLAFENAYVQLWSRPGLTLKERSLVTISILIALGNEKELAIHLASGLRNGLTGQELEEVIYHSTAYAGFPRASDALAIATKVVAEESGRK
jgi:4-carboxymuconolactone decarboxylase